MRRRHCSAADRRGEGSWWAKMRTKLSCNIDFVGIFSLATMMSLACFGDGVWYDDDCFDGFCDEPLNCPEGIPQRQWIVTNSSQAQALAEAVRCSGGVFEVEWDGSVVINEAFVIANDTVLNVYGSGSEAAIDGNGITRIFTVVNTTLNLNNITLANGNAASGGAIAAVNSVLSFQQTTFYGNIASSNGGALLVSNGSSASFDGDTTLWNNTAGENGGALYVSGGSASTWFGDAMFSINTAANGGAIFATGASNVSLRGDTEFYGNVANSGDEGDGGGAIFVGHGAEVEWDGVTNFTSNTAFWDGGAVSAKTTFRLAKSRILMRGPTYFVNNTCGGNGGAMSLRTVSSVSFGAMGVMFYGNSANLAGGAFFISEIGSETSLIGVAFIGNSAQVGGAVYTSLSQSTITIEECSFVDNTALVSGGAMENSGRVSFTNTSFVGNIASNGGALRLNRITSLQNCLFVDNVSQEGGGAAILNIGIISTLSDISFGGNLYSCDYGNYLIFNNSKVDEGTCSGCPPCDGCQARDKDPMCVEAPEHTWSPGGTTTVEGLLIDPGYWRATNTSTNILECYTPSACLGGLTGDVGQCAEGYEGLYCSTCAEGYREGQAKTCMKCSGKSRGILDITICLVVVGIVLVLYRLSRMLERLCGGFMKRLVRHVPFQSIRIIIVTWQILKQFTSSMATSYTVIYETFLDIIAVFNFDLGWVISLDCFGLDFHERMLLTTLGPNVVLALLGMSYTVAIMRHRDSETSLKNIRGKHLKTVLLVTFLVYATVSSVLFPMFSCDDLDDGHSYLREDYTIQCNSTTHRSLQIYAGFMILLYSVGVPVFYSWLLFRNRDVLMDGATRGDDPKVKSMSDLWEAYKPSRFYYEIIECIRRLAITLTLSMIAPGTTAQLSATIMVTFGFGILTEALDPYDSLWDTWMSRAGYVIECSSMFHASQLEADAIDEYNRTSRSFDVTLVVANACMVLTVVIRGLWSVRSSRVYELDGPSTEQRRNDTRVGNERILVCVETMTGEVRKDVV